MLMIHAAPARGGRSCKQDRGELPPSCDRVLVRRTPGLEELNELLARAVLVPTAVAAYNFKKLVHGFLALAAGVETERQIESGLMIDRIRLEAALEFRQVAEGCGLLGEFDRGARAGERRIVGLGLRRHGDEAPGRFDVAEVHMELREGGERRDVLGVLSQNGGVELGGPRCVALRGERRGL